MPAKKLPADDLFEKSSMSFGDHLEELRRALAKAFVWLGLGTIIGLLFAKQIVQFIETPLKQAIRDFHVAQAKEQYSQANGVAIDEIPSTLANWMTTEGLMPERIFLDPEQLGNISPAISPAPTADVDQENTSDAKPSDATPSDVAPSDASGDQPNGNAEPENEDSTPDVDSESEETDSGAQKAADSPAAEQLTLDSDAAGTSQLSRMDTAAAQTTAPLDNPWKGIDIAKLERLEPILLWRPISNKLISLTAIEGFMIWLKAGLVAGAVIGSPGIFWHIWQFLAAGLYPHERRYVYWYLPLSLLLFLAGVCLAFFVVFRLVLGFLMTYTSGMDVEFTPRLNDYMSFALFLPLGFGVAFQLPIVMLGLHRFGLVSVATFVAQWRLAVLSIAFMSMLLTPADIYSMLGLFIPLVGLYFFGIGLCKYMPTGAGIGGPAADPQG